MVIKRISDEIFDNETFTRIAKNLKKQNKKLFSVVNSEPEAKKVKNDLNVNGYQASYEKTGEYFNVYYSPEVPKFKADEKILKDFKNLGNNKYQAYNKTSIAGVYDYGFDEGSIWTLKTYEDGQQYLVKEINGDDENDVVRTKKASSNEQKDMVSNTINNSGKYKVLLEKLDKKIIATLKEGKCVVTDNLVSEIREKLIMNGFNNASKNIVLSIAKSETTEKGGNR